MKGFTSMPTHRSEDSSCCWVGIAKCWIKCHDKLDFFFLLPHTNLLCLTFELVFVRSESCMPVFFSPSQHNPWPDRPGQPTARTGLPEERRRTLYSFRQMDKSAQHSQPSNCQQAHMMACWRQGKRHASNTFKLCFCARGFFSNGILQKTTKALGTCLGVFCAAAMKRETTDTLFSYWLAQPPLCYKQLLQVVKSKCAKENMYTVLCCILSIVNKQISQH